MVDFIVFYFGLLLIQVMLLYAVIPLHLINYFFYCDLNVCSMKGGFKCSKMNRRKNQIKMKIDSEEEICLFVLKCCSVKFHDVLIVCWGCLCLIRGVLNLVIFALWFVVRNEKFLHIFRKMGLWVLPSCVSNKAFLLATTTA